MLIQWSFYWNIFQKARRDLHITRSRSHWFYTLGIIIECFHARGQHLCKFIGTKESVCIRKEFNSQRTGFGHQHGRRFIVLGHQYGHRDVMWKHSIQYYIPSETVTHKIKILVFLFWFHFHFIPDNVTFYYIDTAEIPGFFLLLKNYIFIAGSEDTIFIFHVWGMVSPWLLT